MKAGGADIFGHRLDIVIQPPPFVNLDHQGRCGIIGFGKIGGYIVAGTGAFGDYHSLAGFGMRKINIGQDCLERQRH